MRSPDAAWMSNTRIVALRPSEKRGFWQVCPEFIVELVSEFDSRSTVEEKMRMWIGNGADVAWLIDPYGGEAIMYRAGHEPEKMDRPEFLVRDGPVIGLKVPMQRFWSFAETEENLGE